MFNFNYYLWASYRRRMLDGLQRRHKHLYTGVVLDIGGRDRGAFKKPRDKVDRWIFVDSETSRNPEIVADVANMDMVGDDSVDVVNAIELFEHVARPEAGLRECYRVLKRGGVMLLSAPFLAAVHADPSDYQRWTEAKWRRELEIAGFAVERCVVMGRFFTHVMEAKKTLVKRLPRVFRTAVQLAAYPLMDLIARLDNTSWVARDDKLKSFHGGYFIVARKFAS